ncbi:hypothetical protein JOD02_001661 [Caldicoprobacter guelmensis]|uniref:hypothetical protein n=1 Tax=Caldicoprobacter guelmensis TaxID=1170224 RepID=UPI00195CE0E8|nr:hypothetical protein [Caldicoprobacter guelmensis]MBM7582792.1 hypothetical protein [Caldicoprobacter guelmensis]
MNQKGFTQLYWGFLFIMLDFRIQGVDILPDIVGYIFFASGFRALASNSEYFNKASGLNIPMIILSIFSIYEKPVQGSGININFGASGILGILIGVVSLILELSIVYYLFMGIKEMSNNVYQDIYEEADRRWSQYLMLQIAVLLGFIVAFIPVVNFVYIIGVFVASIILMFIILGFLKRCGEKL